MHDQDTTARVAELVPDEQRATMMENSRRILAGEDLDPVPSVRLFAPGGGQSWLLTEIADDGDTAYGLCDMGIGLPECGEVSLSWLASQADVGKEYRKPSPYGLSEAPTVHTHMRVERDPHFPRHDTPTLSHLDRAASAAGRIVL